MTNAAIMIIFNDINLKATDHSPEASFVPCTDIKSICKRVEVANDVISDTGNAGPKIYHSIPGFTGVAPTVLAQSTTILPTSNSISMG